VSQSGSFDVKNGRTNVEFTVTPLSTLTCPGNQIVVVESFSYNLTLSLENSDFSVDIVGP